MRARRCSSCGRNSVISFQYLNAVRKTLLGTHLTMSERDYYIQMVQTGVSYCRRAEEVMLNN
jgi:hypothetical protein